MRRTQILTAARACFGETGFYPTKMDDIAIRAGLSKGLIYQFFPSKEALIEGIITADLESELAWLERHSGEGSIDLHNFLTGFNDPVGGIRLRLQILAELSLNEALNARVREKQRVAVRTMLERLRESMPDDGGPDLEERLRMIMGLYLGIRTQIAIDGTEGKDRLLALTEALGRALGRGTILCSFAGPSDE